QSSGLYDADQPQAIVYNVSRFYNPAEKRFLVDVALTKTSNIKLPLRFIKINEQIDEAGNTTYEEQLIDIGNIDVIGSTEIAPLGVMSGTNAPEGIALLVSESSMAKLKQQEGITGYKNALYIASD